jgi:hypothetical protein
MISSVWIYSRMLDAVSTGVLLTPQAVDRSADGRRRSGGTVPHLDDPLDRRSSPPEALAARDPKELRDPSGRQLSDVPQVQEPTVGLVQILHPSPELGSLVQALEQAHPDAVGELRGPPRRPHQEDG